MHRNDTESWEKLQSEELDAEEAIDEGAENLITEDFGIVYEDREELACGTKELERDVHRWELDPASSEDFVERSRTRRRALALKWRHFTHSDQY